MKKMIYRTKMALSLIMLALLFGVISTTRIIACDIDIKVTDNKKDKYSIDDELVVKVTVYLTHRNCPEGIEKTKFDSKGITILGATKWTEKATGVYERKLKLKITGTEKGDVMLNAVRTCDKEGGFASISLKAEPVK